MANAEGWFAEARVPVSSLRFQDEKGDVVMGIALQRKIARKTECLVYPPVPAENDWAFLKPSLAQKILLRGLRAKKPLYITAYGLGELDHTADRKAATSTSFDSGVDLKYGLTNNLTLDVTFNTDFAQVEADDQQVNLTRFSLFYPEKRQFFQERSGIFDFQVGRLSRLFHSRRIGLTPDGTPVPLWGGTRLVGRIGHWDVGTLDLQTRESGSLPSENFGAAYHRVPRLLEDLQEAYDDGHYLRALKRLAKRDVLILDDFGLHTITTAQQRHLLELMDDRYTTSSTIVTSQYPAEKLHATMQDPTLADAILDRLIHNAHKIPLAGASMRKKHSVKTTTTTPQP